MKKYIEAPAFETGDGIRLRSCPLVHGEVTFVSCVGNGWRYEVKLYDDGKVKWYNEDELMV